MKHLKIYEVFFNPKAETIIQYYEKDGIIRISSNGDIFRAFGEVPFIDNIDDLLSYPSLDRYLKSHHNIDVDVVEFFRNEGSEKYKVIYLKEL